MEIQNQNNINVTQDRLDEMKAIKDANQKVLDDINTQGAALAKNKASFNEQKQADLKEVADKISLLARESANHQNLDVVKMQNQIDDLTSQVAVLTKTNADLTVQIAAMQKTSKPVIPATPAA